METKYFNFFCSNQTIAIVCHHAVVQQHPLPTNASGYLVVIAPGAVWLADCGCQFFGGEPVATVTEVGHSRANGVISSEHTSVHWRAGYTA